MFTRAVRMASEFTFPYIGLRRRHSGQVYSNLGAFVIVNADGWAVTSAHLIEEILAVQRETASPSAEVGASAESCADHAEIWALPGFDVSKPRLAEAIVRPIADIALVRLEPFDLAIEGRLPLLRDSEKRPIEQGMSVCRLGYPFHDIGAEWSDSALEFALPPHAFPVPSFALEGIVARFRRVSADDASGHATFLETSTPGLRGQSGGPLVDVEGRLCGIQSHTTHLDLGFDARYSLGDQVVTERQFLNVGAATHIADVVSFLDEVGVNHALD
jgi:hypothetical protein